jgi:hypothetical protein
MVLTFWVAALAALLYSLFRLGRMLEKNDYWGDGSLSGAVESWEK